MDVSFESISVVSSPGKVILYDSVVSGSCESWLFNTFHGCWGSTTEESQSWMQRGMILSTEGGQAGYRSGRSWPLKRRQTWSWGWRPPNDWCILPALILLLLPVTCIYLQCPSSHVNCIQYAVSNLTFSSGKELCFVIWRHFSFHKAWQCRALRPFWQGWRGWIGPGEHCLERGEATEGLFGRDPCRLLLCISCHWARNSRQGHLSTQDLGLQWQVHGVGLPARSIDFHIGCGIMRLYLNIPECILFFNFLNVF